MAVFVLSALSLCANDGSSFAAENYGFGALGHRYGVPQEVVTDSTHNVYCDEEDVANCTVRVSHGVCAGRSCVACTEQPTQWLTTGNIYTFENLLIQGNCSDPGSSGTLEWPVGSPVLTGVTVQGTDTTSRSTIRGPCPLLRVGAGSKVLNVDLVCTNGGNARAGIQVLGPNVQIDGVRVEGAPVFTAAQDERIDLTDLSITNVESSGKTCGAIANVYTDADKGGPAKIACLKGEYLIVQPMSRFVYSATGCVVINVGELIGLYGSEYEIEFFTRYGGANGLSKSYANVIATEAIILAVIILYTAVEHQDALWLVRTRKNAEGAEKLKTSKPPVVYNPVFAKPMPLDSQMKF
jgi:hypothetical protein